MEIWNRILLIFVGIAGALILISVATNFWKTRYPWETLKLKGSKEYVVEAIVKLIYNCFEENRWKRRSIICRRLFVESEEEILSSDILNSIDMSRMAGSDLRVDDIGYSGEIIIRCENQTIYVEKVEYERIST